MVTVNVNICLSSMFWSKLQTNTMRKQFFPLILVQISRILNKRSFDQTDCPIHLETFGGLKRNTKSYCTESGTKIRRGTSGWSENLEQLVFWPTCCRFYITVLCKPFMLKWFSYIVNDFRISYMICSIENIVSYPYFMIDVTNFVVFAIDFDFYQSELYIILIVLT